MLSCPFCSDPIAADAPHFRCKTCNASYHQACGAPPRPSRLQPLVIAMLASLAALLWVMLFYAERQRDSFRVRYEDASARASEVPRLTQDLARAQEEAAAAIEARDRMRDAAEQLATDLNEWKRDPSAETSRLRAEVDRLSRELGVARTAAARGAADADFGRWVQGEMQRLRSAYWTRGSTRQEVYDVQGTPTGLNVYETLGVEVWAYGHSSVTFKRGVVHEFANREGNLRVR